MTQASAVVPFDAEDEWANSIKESWGQGVQSFIETGRRLAAAKADLDHGRFLEMVKAQLPFNIRTVDKYMAIAAHPVIGNWSIQTNLPASWTTLYDLTRWEEPELKLAIGNGLLAGDTKRVDLKDIHNRVRRQLRGVGSAPKKSGKAKSTNPVQFLARFWKYLDLEQITAVNSLSDRDADDLCVELARTVDTKLGAKS